MEICILIGGRRVCIQVPLLVEVEHFRGPVPGNMPELELAATVIRLVELVRPAIKGEARLAQQLQGACNSFIEQIKQQLPEGVELNVRG